MAPTTKKGASSPKARSSTSKMTLKRVKGENFYRDAKAAARVKMLNGGKPVYDRDGKIKKAAAFQKGEDETKPGRVQPDRRWFGNTKVISQTALDHFRSSLSTRVNDPYSVLLKRNKLPMSLLDEALNPNTRKRSHIVETEPFEDTFGPKAQRKRPRLDVGTFEELSHIGQEIRNTEDANAALPGAAEAEALALDNAPTHGTYLEPIYAKGTSRRIYAELYKVIDSSDVILHILDARDPFGTMCNSVLDYIKKEKAHKQVVLILNKCDLVPNWVTGRYISHLSALYPTLAFHASPNHSFGKGSLIQLLRQFSVLHSDKKQISVGLVGYPNVGKSSVINTLKSSKVCTVAPVPGETKVWQYITLTKRIYMIDCPGIVPSSNAKDSTTETVLKGVVRVEALPVPSEHIPAVLERVKPIYISRTYGIPLPDDGRNMWDPEEFLEKLARIKGRLLKAGQPDIEGVAKILLSDWVRGRIPYFVAPPDRKGALLHPEVPTDTKVEKGKGRAGEKKVLGVKQNLGSIMQRNKYDPQDIQPLDQEFVGGDEGLEQRNEVEVGVKYGAEESKSQDEGAEIDWEEAFGTVETAEQRSAPRHGRADDEEKQLVKEPRMTTNKKKAENFFTNANVKNKNRDKAALLRGLAKEAHRKGAGAGDGRGGQGRR